MYIEILSVSKKKETDTLPRHTDELRDELDKYGFYLTQIKKANMSSSKIHTALDKIAASNEKPDVIIIANVLDTRDSKSFRKYFVETVAAAERAENKPDPKNYWKKRNNAFRNAKKQNASKDELEALENEYKMYRKKAKVFSLGDFGYGFNGYCFMYKGMRVATVPKASLVGVEFAKIAALAAVRTTEVYENSENEYPEGFSIQEYVPAKTGFVNNFIPIRGDSGKEIARKSVVIVAFLVFLAALALLFYNMVFLSVKNAQLNGEIQRIAHGTEDGGNDGNKKPDVGEVINWKALKDINKEIVGWVQLDNTQIDYPVLWHKGDDRNGQYYLSRNYKGGYDSFGSIFLDYRCEKGTKSQNVVLHGHHMNDGSMFGNLLNYGATSPNLDFYKKTPTVEFDTPDGKGTYKIISVFKTNTLSAHGEFFNYMVGDFQNEKDFMNYVYNVRIRSMINCPVDVNEDDELLTLSTCSYEFTNFRTVVVARKVRLGESKKVDVSKASRNKNAVWPKVYYSAYGGTRPKVTDFCTAYDAKQIDWYSGEYDFKEQKIKPTVPDTTVAASTDASGKTVPVTETKVYLTVKFINYDGSEIETQKVEYGKNAKKPKNPVKPSDKYYDYVFKGWQLDYTNVTRDMIIAPNFEAVLKPEYADAVVVG